jgi:hypothetical protein
MIIMQTVMVVVVRARRQLPPLCVCGRIYAPTTTVVWHGYQLVTIKGVVAAVAVVVCPTSIILILIHIAVP